jgi:GH35 family endo-1,4-beta-xylanase
MRKAVRPLLLLCFAVRLHGDPLPDFSTNTPSARVSRSADSLVFETLKPCDWPWDIQATAASALAVKAGDHLLASFRARAVRSTAASGEALFYFGFEQARDPWAKSVDQPLRAGARWTRMQVPFQAAADYAPGAAQMVFRIGFTPQAFEIRDFRLTDEGSQQPPASIPSYPGREKNAAWRKAALARIQKLRTAPLTVKVVDASGKPLRGARVRARQTKSAFRWGTAISAKTLFLGEESPDKARYREAARQYFNIVTEENSFKWKSSAGDNGPGFSLGLGLRAAEWAREAGLDFRGHNLLWPSWHNSPKLAEKLKDRPAELRRAILDHVRETVAAAQGQVADWDVINEPWDNHDIMDALGGDAILADCFRAAAEADPRARLFINDYAIIEGGPGESTHRARYERVIHDLIQAGVRLDGIGIQGHFGQPLTAPVDCLQTLDRFAAFKRPLLITEYDIEETDEALTGDYLRDLLILCYSHPAVEGFMMWGFWDAKHWHKNAPLFHQDWSPKPALKVWQELVLGAWRSDEKAVTGDAGQAQVRAHLGDYEVWVEKDGKSLRQLCRLGKEGQVLTVTLP